MNHILPIVSSVLHGTTQLGSLIFPGTVKSRNLKVYRQSGIKTDTRTSEKLIHVVVQDPCKILKIIQRKSVYYPPELVVNCRPAGCFA